MNLDSVLKRILVEPTPDDVWSLHPHLLASGADEPTRQLAERFYVYLSGVRSKLTSKQYSFFAAALASGSIGTFAIQDVWRAYTSDREHFVRDVLAGGLAATFEALSTFQHVKAWETEFTTMHDEAGWFLYAALWQVSTEYQPTLPFEQRRALLEQLLAPARDPNMNSAVRMGLIVRVFQVLLMIRVVPLSIQKAIQP